MKRTLNQFFPACWVCSILLTSLIFSESCNQESGQGGGGAQRTATLGYLDTIEAAKKWFKINDLADAYIVQVKEKYLAIPLNKKAGEVYMKAYRGLTSADRELKRTLAVIISDTSLAFYVRYLLDSSFNHVQASFGQYDLQALQAAGARDIELERNAAIKNFRKTLVFGIPYYPRPGYNPARPNEPTYYTRPFIVSQDTFYDNWHEIWP